jgi:hypothetical protein
MKPSFRDLRRLAAALKAPTVQDERDAHALNARVMAALDAPQLTRPPAKVRSLRIRARLFPVLAAAALLATIGVSTRTWLEREQGAITARGAMVPNANSLARRTSVAVRFATSSAPVYEGALLSPREALVLSYRNLELTEKVYVAIFLVDAKNEMHWLYPAFERAEDSPASVRLEVRTEETLMAFAVRFDDIAPGPARLLLLRTRTPVAVKTLEILPRAELCATQLLSRYPGAIADEIHVTFDASVSPH